MKLGVTGHQLLPVSAREALQEAVQGILESSSEVEACCSLASGADQLVADLVLRSGGTLDAVIPSQGYSESFGSQEDMASFRRLIGRARDVSTLPFPEPTEEAFLAAGLVVVERSDHLLAVWDGEPARGLGGTADVVAYARQRRIPVQVVWPEGLRR